jgi:hypothetical protein
MTDWHVDDDALRRWISRTDSLSEGASFEQHLVSCDGCRAPVNAAVAALAWRETRRYVRNPVFLIAAGLTVYVAWDWQHKAVQEINTVSV